MENQNYKIEIGQIVYLKTDPEQKERIVTAILFRPTGITYELTQATDQSWHYAFEIAIEKDILKTI